MHRPTTIFIYWLGKETLHFLPKIVGSMVAVCVMRFLALLLLFYENYGGSIRISLNIYWTEKTGYRDWNNISKQEEAGRQSKTLNKETGVQTKIT